MVSIAAWWGLGYAALLVSLLAHGRQALRRHVRENGPAPDDAGAGGWVACGLSTLSTLLLWTGLVSRARAGHGWPIVTVADAAAAIALCMLLVHSAWSLLAPRLNAGLAATSLSLLLLSYGLSQFPRAPVTLPMQSKASLLSGGLNVVGASLLGLAAAYSLTSVLSAYNARRSGRSAWDSAEQRDRASEALVRIALLCLAVGLAVDTWWLQEVGLGREGDAQQAGIAIGWVVYFVALRLRTSARWRGWPWASILTVGFFCILPILLDVAWLGNALPI
ncbi:MAG: hypothetical protein JXA09_13710 [Anaerolineae bacterium]|nr:hypothetical protein [Anaerolineae bacterium]